MVSKTDQGLLFRPRRGGNFLRLFLHNSLEWYFSNKFPPIFNYLFPEVTKSEKRGTGGRDRSEKDKLGILESKNRRKNPDFSLIFGTRK